MHIPATAGLRYLLPLLALGSLASAAEYFVSTSGSDANNGTSLGTAFRTITHASTRTSPGDTVWVASGTYPEPATISVSGNAGAYIRFAAIAKWGPKIAVNTGGNAVNIDANYIEVDGLDVTNPGGHGINCENQHHIRVLNCRAHHCGNSGITGGYSDFYHFEGNVCHNNAWLSWYSGISIYQARSIGDSSPGFHIIIRGNISYSNLTQPAASLHTDGNGIIIDDWNQTQTTGQAPYPFTALVENNLCYDNGGAGIKTCWSDNITIRNNITYRNNTDSYNSGTYRGDLYCQSSRNNVWVNNIGWADPSLNANNTAMMDKGAASGGTTTANIWRNNIFFNGTVGQASIATGDGSSPTLIGNLAGVDPRFVSPGSDFRLLAASPAIDAGSTLFGIPAADLLGVGRPSGAAVDIGAYEYASTGGSNSAPVLVTAIPDRTASVGVAFSYTVPAGTFSDADGDSLTWSSNESLGWLGFNAATRTFSGTPAAGDIGSTAITVSVGDGSLGASDTFQLTVAASPDTTAPDAPDAPTIGNAGSSTPSIGGTTEAGATVRVYVDGILVGTATADGSGAWTHLITPALPAGAHQIQVSAVDGAGNASALSPATTVTVAATAGKPLTTSSAGGSCGAGGLSALLMGCAAALAFAGGRRRRAR